MTDATSALLDAIRGRLAWPAVLEEVRSRAWASVTFSGARHEIALRLEGTGSEAAADRFVATLGQAEFELRGHILADIALVAQERGPQCQRLRIEALTVEDR